jgi:hypothetical protein
MKKIILILLTFYFFLDFSFLPIINKSYLGGACLLISFLILLLAERTFLENIFWIILTAFFINIISPFYFVIYLIIWLIIMGIIYLIKMIFIDENLNIFKRNIIFILALLFYKILLNLSYSFSIKNITLQNIFNFRGTSWQILVIKFIIMIISYNIVYKIFSKLINTTSKSKLNLYK